MKMVKMTKQVKQMVSSVNEYLKENHVKNQDDRLFSDMCWLLLQSHCYNGFNFYTEDGKLSGENNEKFDHLEIYIF